MCWRLAAINGFVSEPGEGISSLADRSMALVSQASEVASNYVEDHAGMIPGTGENGREGQSVSVIGVPENVQRDVQRRVQASLVCAQRTMVRHQAEDGAFAGYELPGTNAKACSPHHRFPDRNIVIQVPQSF